MSERIDSEAVERRRARLPRIFADIIEHAQVQCLSRCPYRDSRDLCTAQFGCRNQGPVDAGNGLSSCLCDGELDYRGAWEVEDPEAVLAQWRAETRTPVPSVEGTENPNQDTLRPGAVDCVGHGGATLFEVADAHEVRVDSSCGRMGSGHEGVGEVLEGGGWLSERGEEERFLDERFRLACQAKVGDADSVTFAPLRRTPHVLTRRSATRVEACPAVKREGESVLRAGESIDQWRGRLVGLAVDVGTTTVAAELIDL